MFWKRPNNDTITPNIDADFSYLPSDACYLDSACQTLRPNCVIDAEREYYTCYNACGGRVKYRWGETVDRKVKEARKGILSFAGKSESEYAVALTLNTTYGINLVLQQLPGSIAKGIVTSEIEHNSVLLPAITWSKRHGADLAILPRDDAGDLIYEKKNLERSILLMNTMSNIDGRVPAHMPRLANDAHAAGGLVLLDGAQGFAHATTVLRETDFDAAFGSGHKMYGPSIGFIIIKRTLLARLEPFLLGGGTVQDVSESDFALLRDNEEAHAILEPGLQNWSGILGLAAAIAWRKTQSKNEEREQRLAKMFFDGLKNLPRVRVLNTHPSSVTSFTIDGIDAHALALFLSEQNIMCRSGYFCCHRYLLHQRKLPPQLRVSLGLYNTEAHIEKCLAALGHIGNTL